MWSKWSDFALTAGGVAPVPSKWELVYVNKIVPPSKDLGWEKIIPGLFHKELVTPEAGRLIGRRCQWVWDLDELSTRLVVEARPSLNDPKDSIVMTVTARGEAHPTKDIWQAIDDGHELSVNFFESVVSKEMLLECGEIQ